MSTLQTKLQALRWELNSILLEREIAIEAAGLALLTGEHPLLLGPPSTAKPLVVRSICERIEGTIYFERLLTRSSLREIFGWLSLAALGAVPPHHWRCAPFLAALIVRRSRKSVE